MKSSYTPGPRPSFKAKEESSTLQVLPQDVSFICAYLCFMNPIDFGESAFFRRGGGFDELWITTWDADLDPGYRDRDQSNPALFDDFKCRAIIKANGTIEESCLNLLYHNTRSNMRYCSPSGFVRAGILAEADFNLVVQSIKGEINANAKKASDNRAEIVQTAEELGLHPRPDGESPHSWHASCPGTSHPIWIDTRENIFGCPWCKKKGGPDVLKEFVEERRLKGYKW